MAASLRDVWRVLGRERTRTLVILSRRVTVISSPAFTACEDLAAFPLTETRPASQILWATVRREQIRLALRKTSRRMTSVSSSKSQVSRAPELETLNLKLGTYYGFGKIPS